MSSARERARRFRDRQQFSQRMAGAEITDVTEQARILAHQMERNHRSNEGIFPERIEEYAYVPDDPVLGVHIFADRTDDSLMVPPRLDGEVYGSREGYEQMIQADPQDLYKVTWGNRFTIPGSRLTDADRLSVLRLVQERLPEFMKKLPDNVILEEMPDGADSRNFNRANLYSGLGFGPSGDDNRWQYAHLKDGKANPIVLQPPHGDYLKDLRRRLTYRTNPNEVALREQIDEELRRRREFNQMRDDGGIRRESFNNESNYPQEYGSISDPEIYEYYKYKNDFEPGIRSIEPELTSQELARRVLEQMKDWQ